MYDAIVVGVGGMGSATLYHLARSGAKVLGLEQFGIGHALGSSHGSTRIIRLAYSEGAEYVPLLRAAYRYWNELGELSGKRILRVTGGLDIGGGGSWTVTGSRESCIAHGLDYEELDGNQVNRRFPGYCLPPTMRAIHQPDGGYLLCESAIESHARLAGSLGAELRTNTRVVGWSSHSAGIRVATSEGEFEAKRLVVTAGPWVGVLSAELGPLCRPERQVMLWTRPLEERRFRPDRFPVFNMESPYGRYYGFPDHRGEGFKIGKYHHLGQVLDDPDRTDRACHPEDEAALREGISRYFPYANGPTCRTAVCLFTNTPDHDFILDRHPAHRNVFVAAGFSGHGFKFCSVVGKIMSEFCLDSTPTWDLERFALSAARMERWRNLPQSPGRP